MVKKIEIAKELGLHVATISRILNEVPDYRASKETVQKVFKTARDMGYDFEKQKRFYKRKHQRVNVDARVRLQARMADGEIISHEARMCNIGEGGVLLINFRPKILTLPLRQEDLSLEIVSGELKGIMATCEVVRIGRHSGSFGICLEIKGKTAEDAASIEEFVNEKLAEKK